MSQVSRIAGVDGTFNYALNEAPTAPPVLTVYSDSARTVVVVAATPTTATANPTVFVCAYPGSLPAGTYYLDLASVFILGQPAFHDQDDLLTLQAPQGSVVGNVVSTAEVRALVNAEQGDDDLAAITAREESWLARRVEQLAGPRTQQFWVGPERADSDLALRRPTDSVVILDGGVALDPIGFRLLENGTQIERILGYWWGTTDRTLLPVQVTYTPNDLDEVKAVVIELVRMRLSETGYTSEQTGQYRYDRAGADKQRAKLAASLLAQHGAGTIALRSTEKPDRVGSRSWTTWSVWP